MQHTATMKTPLHRRPLLELDYGPDVPLAVLHALERAGRRIGLPLHQMELLGQDEQTARGFVAAVEEGRQEEYIEGHVDWAVLEAKLFGRPPVRN